MVEDREENESVKWVQARTVYDVIAFLTDSRCLAFGYWQARRGEPMDPEFHFKFKSTRDLEGKVLEFAQCRYESGRQLVAWIQGTKQPPPEWPIGQAQPPFKLLRILCREAGIEMGRYSV